MSNITAHRDLIQCVGAALVISAAFIVVSMPKPDTAAASTTDHAAKAGCRQTWPYYERSCLHDSRQLAGNARVVRVIAISGQAGHLSRH